MNSTSATGLDAHIDNRKLHDVPTISPAAAQSTGLVRHVFRLLQTAIDAKRPVPWVLLENVEALLDRQAGKLPAVHYVVCALEALGYGSWAQRVICSAAFGVPQRRKRVFLLASWHGDARDVLLSQVRATAHGTTHAEHRARSGDRPVHNMLASFAHGTQQDRGILQVLSGVSTVPAKHVL